MSQFDDQFEYLSASSPATLKREFVEPRPASEYHEDMGNVLWWRLEPEVYDGPSDTVTKAAAWAGEPPYVGTTNDLGHEVVIGKVSLEVYSSGQLSPQEPQREINECRFLFFIGGWRDDYYTHFTPIPIPELPK